ncbi:MAG: hypothetical protein ACM358_08845 [Gemmatimonadota bacterium]
MKNAWCLFLLVMTTPAAAQMRGFVELDTRLSVVRDQFATFTGVRAAVMPNPSLYVGLVGTGLATSNATVAAPAGASTLRMGYGGLLIGTAPPTPGTTRIFADVLVGAGGLSAEGLGRDAIFVLEPALGADLKLAGAVRFAIGASYRFVSGVDLPSLAASDLRGVSATIALRLGWY